MRLSVQVPALCAAWVLIKDRKYADHAADHLRAWFINPATVAVIGAGNVHYSDLLRVPLLIIDQGAANIGETAARILVDCMRAKTPPAPKCVVITPRLIVRDSSRRGGVIDVSHRCTAKAS